MTKSVNNIRWENKIDNETNLYVCTHKYILHVSHMKAILFQYAWMYIHIQYMHMHTIITTMNDYWQRGGGEKKYGSKEVFFSTVGLLWQEVTNLAAVTAHSFSPL